MYRISILLFTFGLLVVPRVTLGCALGPRPTVLEAYNNADVVVIARAISIEKTTDQELPLHGSRVVSTTMEVQKVFKGNLRVGEKITFGQGNGIRCTWVFYEDVIGTEYLFYVQKPPNASDLWYEFGYSRSDVTSRTADDLLYLNNMDKVRGRTRVSGTIDPGDDETDRAGRRIWIVGKDKIYETKTDKNGVYEFYDLPAGRYALEPELPLGLRIDRETRGTTTISDERKQISTKQVRFTLKPRQHAAIDLEFVLDNIVSGTLVDSRGKPLPGVQVSLEFIDPNKKSFSYEYTDEQGRFAIESIEPGSYILVINGDGKKTIAAPFGTFYHPNVTEKAKAQVFRIQAGDNIKDLKIVAPQVEGKVAVQGVVRYADGTPVRKATVRFKPTKEWNGDGSAMADVNKLGQFSFQVFKGLPGELHADFFAYSGRTARVIRSYDYEKCPQVWKIVIETGKEMIKTPPLKIDPQQNLSNLVLTFPFPPCR